ncbi:MULTISPECIES: iron chelate uptake ABC transporter family permease subunit [unclassified Rathayibacter]|uniref:FecCD family ABC transporter permease n=1 Tax=unclassified Rathayibacter TaxID=2609250 RepID=UPI00104A92C7|nr:MULTISPECIES: iron chelate uptake ABC transporter family permease subunit [unclassified Rathayibacter]TCL77537.1 iron complex transport system permease protein [Rathayibacter sp. PhB192]TCM29636.1 iron complex transport system permease protein [Rathayibacter sp. PhB179]
MTTLLETEAAVPTVRRNRRLGLAASLTALVVAALLSVLVGSNHLGPAELWHALTAYDGSIADQVVVDLRLPRTLAGLVVGAALGVSGAVIQALTRNPLGDPGILGVDAGAALFVAIGVALGASSPAQYLPFAFLGALVVTAVVALIGSVGRGGPDPVRLTLAGVAVAAVLSGVTTAMMLLDPVTFTALRGWNAGSFVERGLDVVLPATPFVLVGVVIALAAARSLTALGLGDDLAASLGTRLGRTRLLSVLAITLLAGSATAIAGPVGFVGLAVPHVARWIAGPDQRWILALSILLAPTLLLLADVLGRVALWPGEVPVGVVTAFVGAPVLIHLVRRAKASSL